MPALRSLATTMHVPSLLHEYDIEPPLDNSIIQTLGSPAVPNRKLEGDTNVSIDTPPKCLRLSFCFFVFVSALSN